MYDKVISVWKKEVAAGGARHRRFDNHQLHLYFGSNSASKPVFFLITEVEPHFLPFADTVSFEKGKRDDGRWTIVLTLRNEALVDDFMGMCVELARRSAAARDGATARAIFFQTLLNWKALLAGNVPRRMSDQQIRGLVAELWYALEVLALKMPVASALIAWQGPYGAPQDFQTADGLLIEIKSVHSGSKSVEVSSVEQLDPTAGGALTLSLVCVDEVPAGVSSHTLASLVDEFRRRLSDDVLHLDELEHRLTALCLDLGDPYYGEHHYSISGPRNYAVSEGFPRVLRAHVPVAVDKLTYRLRIAGFDSFEENAREN